MSSINFDQMNSKYSVHDYYKLSDKFSEDNTYSTLEYAIKMYLSGNMFKLKKSPPIKKQSDSEHYSCLAEWVYSNCLEEYQVLYEAPLDIMPLYINGSFNVSRIAEWRLRIGK